MPRSVALLAIAGTTLAACGGSGGNRSDSVAAKADEVAITTSTTTTTASPGSSGAPSAETDSSPGGGKSHGSGKGKGSGAQANSEPARTPVHATKRTARKEVAKLMGTRTRQGQTRVRSFNCAGGTCTLRYFSNTGGPGAITNEITKMLRWLFRDASVQRGIFLVHHVNGFAPTGGRPTLVLTCDRARWSASHDADGACDVQKRKGASKHGQKLRPS